MEKTWRDRIKNHYPNQEFADDDAYGNAAGDLIDKLKDENGNLTQEQERIAGGNKKLLEIMQEVPGVADFLADLFMGASLPVALARNFNMEDFTPQEGEPDYEAWDKAKSERSAKLSERQKLDEELTANKVESSKAFNDYQTEKGLSDEEMDAFVDKIDTFLGDIYKGKVTRDFLDAVYKATAYDTDLAATRTAALVEGKNTAIEAKKAELPKGDGLPKLGATGEMPEKPVKEPDIFDRVQKNYEKRNRL